MQTSSEDYSSSVSLGDGEQAMHIDSNAYSNASLEIPVKPDPDMLALSADLFSYIDHASAVASGAEGYRQHIDGMSDQDLSTSSLRPASQPSAAGPLRHRRGHQDSYLSINSFTSNNSNTDASKHPLLSDENGEIKTITSSEIRTLSFGDHALKIPLSSPIIPPQLQANVRMTSTGRPSHARKVPDDHVKRPRNAFILFRSYACTNKLLPPSLGITDHRQVSRIVGQLWKGLKPEEKAIWEKLAHEEKEKHKLMNPNYRYRPTYRKEEPSKRRRKKVVNELEFEEEDRKCEVVARVLLEGREVDTDELEREVEEQKLKDKLEGRQRATRTRSRSRSNPKLNERIKSEHEAEAQSFFLGMGGRPSSAPPQGADPFDTNGSLAIANNQSNGIGNRGKRSCTIGATGPEMIMGDYSPPTQQSSLHAQVSHQRYVPDSDGHNLPPSLRNASNLQHLFSNEPTTASSEPTPSGSSYTQFPAVSQSPYMSSFAGFKGGNGDVSLLSPSFSRKFSLGRWEVPHHGTGSAYGHGTQASEHPFTPPQQVTQTPAIPTTALHHTAVAGNGTVSSATSSLGSQEQSNYSTVAQAPSDRTFDPAAVPPGYDFVPTYVYLSKEDAQNPQIVEHYLAQGFGVSYDA